MTRHDRCRPTVSEQTLLCHARSDKERSFHLCRKSILLTTTNGSFVRSSE